MCFDFSFMDVWVFNYIVVFFGDIDIWEWYFVFVFNVVRIEEIYISVSFD